MNEPQSFPDNANTLTPECVQAQESEVESDSSRIHRTWAKMLRTLLICIAVVLTISPPWVKRDSGCNVEFAPAHSK